MHHLHNILSSCTVLCFLHSLSIAQCASVGDPCLSECNCKWKNGKQTVECIGVNLLGIPDGLSSETQVLDLTGNLFQLLPSRAFYRVGLLNLQKVYASRCGLLTIAEDAFYHLNNLVELDISNNFITWIPATALRDTPLLRRLLLSSNPIQRIDNDTFTRLSHLTVLELSSCQIEEVEPRAFDGLKSLEYLKLDGNKLRTLPSEIVKPFSKLYALDLHQNPWQCDCHMRSVRVWMVRQNIPMSSPPQCSEPGRLRGLSWDAVGLDDFACQPRVTVVEPASAHAEGDNATLGCRVQAVPEGAVSWFWRGRIVNNLTLMSFGRQMYLIREVGTTHKVNSLTIFNVMLKDSGRYLCVATNPAGTISANISLNVVPKEGDGSALSGEQISGIVIGVLFVIFALFFVFSFFMMRHQRLFPDRSKAGGLTIYKHFFSLHVAAPPVVKSDPEAASPAVSPVEKWSHVIRETEKGIELRALPDAASQRTEYRRRVAEEWPIADVGQSSWKRHSHVFSADARDSPDEGLGDEREYETDILD